MRINDKLIRLLNCIETFESLTVVHDRSVKQKILENIELPPGINLDAVLANESKTRYYTILDGVVMLNRALILDQDFCKLEYVGLDPFNLNWDNDPDWYEYYLENIVKFKLNHFKQKIPKKYDNVVELVSSNGALLQFLHDQLPSDATNLFIGTDIDYWACRDLNKRGKRFYSICSDAHDRIFKSDVIEYMVSNSIHHLFDYAKVYQNIHLALSRNGVFAGVEADRMISQLVVKMLKFIPSVFIPYSLKEIKAEVTLLERWLQKPISLKLQQYNYKSDYKLFHTLYSLQK